jgi:hypothetical protein
VNTDPRPFVAAALSGMCSRQINGQMAPDPKNPKGPAIVVGKVEAAQLGERAVEIGVAAARALDAWLEANELDEATRPAKKKG